MQLITPSIDDGLGEKWWTPLRALTARLHAIGAEPRFCADDFRIVGRRDRPNKDPVFVYAHDHTGEQVYVGPTGDTFRLAGGRLISCPVWKAPNPYPRERIVQRGNVVLRVIDGGLL